MKNIRIGSRLAIGFSMVLSLMILMTVIGVWRLQEIGARIDSMITNDLVRERMASEWSANIDLNGMRTVALVKSMLSADQEYFKKQIAQTSVRITALQTALEKSLDEAEGRALFNAVLEQRKRYTGVRDAIFARKAAGDGSAVEAVDQLLVPLLKEYSARVTALVSYQRDMINRKAASVDREYRSGCLLLAGVGIISLLLGALASWRLAVGITRPLQHAVQATESVAAGNLGTQIIVSRGDEIGKLQSGLKTMTRNLLDTVREVKTGAETIATASTQIASGNLDLSARTEQQASSLEQTVTAVEELTAAVQHNANNALEAKHLAASASDTAMEGGAVVGQVIDTMQAINASSRRIVDIISVIDGIAFQTNILALNAAVEAARAGEQGRGFAVVASEVRSLAQRSASAAKEIKALIDDSVQQVDSGSQLVELAGRRMTDVVGSVKRVSDIVAEISAATQEQSAGISEVSRAIAQMDQATQQNAALVEHAAAAAESLQGQARHLTGVVAVFQIGASTGAVIAR